MRKLRDKIARFMYGRYGTDTLYHCTYVVIFVLVIVNLFVSHIILPIIELILITWTLFRFFSKNIYKRQRENQLFLAFFRRIGSFFKLRKNKIKYRKTHVFRKCPTCKNQLRLPRQKGKHTVSCPCCKNRFDVKI